MELTCVTWCDVLLFLGDFEFARSGFQSAVFAVPSLRSSERAFISLLSSLKIAANSENR